jgi:sugar-specific transcriptional regulator TrmB
MAKGDLDWALLAIGMEMDEVRLYRVLVTQGPCTVGGLAASVDLSRTKAYSVLDGMVAKGYAELVNEHPRTYFALDPDILLARRIEDLGSAKEVIQNELSPLFEEQRAHGRNISLRGMAVLSRTEEMLKRARREIVFVVSFVPAELNSRFAAVLDELHARGVKARTVVSDAVIDSVLVDKLRRFTDLRVRKVPNAGMLIVDDEEVLIGSLTPPDASSGGKVAPYRLHGLWSRDSELIKLQRMLFEDIYRGGVA